MARVRGLEVEVDVDISKALAALTELQDELRDVAAQIEEVDAIGSDGISVRTDVDQLDTELAALATEIEAFERTADIDIPVRIDQSQFGMLRGLFRDAMVDAFEMADFPGGGGRRGGVAGGAAAGGAAGATRGAFGIPEGVGGAFDMMFGTRGRDADSTTSLFGSLNGLLENLHTTTRGFDIRMSDIHNLLASLIPLLVVFIGTLPAAITALLTLAGAALAAAAAFVAIAGLGALGAATAAGGGGMPTAEDFQQFWTEIRDAFFEAFAPLAERLAPIFLEGLDGLEKFFMAIASQGDALVGLTDEARAFGQFLIDFIPKALRGFAGLIESMAPVLGQLGEFLNNETINVLRSFVRLTMEAMPALMGLLDTIIDALPAIVQLSVGFARVATVVLQLAGFLWRLFTLLGLGNEAIGTSIAAFLALISVVAIANKTFAIFSGTILARMINGLIAMVPANILAAESFGALSVAVKIATLAMVSFLAITGIGLILSLAGGVASLAGGWFGVANGIDSAAKSMKDFNRLAGVNDGTNPYGGRGPRPGSGMDPGGSSSGGGAMASGGGTSVVINPSGNRSDDKSDGNKAAWRYGRTSGSGP